MNTVRILVIDGQGGQIGSQLVRRLTGRYENAQILAVGTNATAAAAMKKAGADQAAAGENPVLVACRRADVIVGPVGVVIADSMLGEVTPAMAAAVAQADAVRVLIPVNRCENLIAGVPDLSLTALIEDALRLLDRAVQGD
ncbi:MAG: DUF3842 family protein [Oscillibacter sp.]|nr:DUF3842 family protein [Oscillibacter sp.]